MNAFADEIGEHFASEPNQEKVLVWLDIIRNEMIDDCCSPVSRMRDLLERKEMRSIACSTG